MARQSMMFAEKLKQFIPVPGISAIYPAVLQIIYFILFAVNDVPGYSLSAVDILSMIFGIVTLILLSSALQVIYLNTIVRRILLTLIIFILWALNAYQLSSGSSLDYPLVRDNLAISFSAEALMMISAHFSNGDILFLIFFLAAVMYTDSRYYRKSAIGYVDCKSSFASFLFWFLLVFIPVQAGDGFTLFAKSYLGSGGTPVYANPVLLEYPYERDTIPLTSISSSVPSSKSGKPNVFLILIESFNANFAEAKAPDGIDYTPNFNSLIKQGLYIDRFYGNSIQTCKGQASVFFSILPSFKGKIFVDYQDLNISGFPAVLENAGYRTVFFQAYHDLKFDNTKNSMIKAGFSIVNSYGEFRRKEDRPSIWGWGVEDKIFYERFFEVLDSIHAKNPGKPVFAALATVGTHIPCDGMPPEKRTIYKDPRNIREKYSNALRLSDSQLPRFFELLKQREYLENSIVIITSDHSFPMREHGIYNNEVCFYDETFRIPFLVIWNGVVKPERISKRAYSQVDIGPTITDMLGISKARNNMTGISVFDRKTVHPVYLVQPYNGRFLQVVNYPLKYISHLKTGKEYLFDLEKDPGETVNLIMQNYDVKKVSGMKESLNALYLNQQLIDSDHIRTR